MPKRENRARMFARISLLTLNIFASSDKLLNFAFITVSFKELIPKCLDTIKVQLFSEKLLFFLRYLRVGNFRYLFRETMKIKYQIVILLGLIVIYYISNKEIHLINNTIETEFYDRMIRINNTCEQVSSAIFSKNRNAPKMEFKNGIVKNRKIAIEIATLLANSFRDKGDTIKYIPHLVALDGDSLWIVTVVRQNCTDSESICFEIRKDNGEIVRVSACK